MLTDYIKSYSLLHNIHTLIHFNFEAHIEIIFEQLNFHYIRRYKIRIIAN